MREGLEGGGCLGVVEWGLRRVGGEGWEERVKSFPGCNLQQH